MAVHPHRCKLCILSVIASSFVSLATTPIHSQNTPAWRLHSAIEGNERPFLCKDRESVNLIFAIERRALQLREGNDGGKSNRLSEIATRLQSELCSPSAPDDIVILRCKIDQQNVFDAQLST